MEIVSEQYIHISFGQLVSSVDRLLHTNYSEVEEYRINLNDLDIVKLAVSSLVQADTIRMIGPTDSVVKYRMDMKLEELACLILVWERMARVLMYYSTNENIAPNSQKHCFRALTDMVKYSVADSQLFSVLLRKLSDILKYKADNIGTNGIQYISETVDELGKKWEFGKEPTLSRTDDIFQTMEYWSNSSEVRNLLAALHAQKGSLCVKELAQKCYFSWYKLVQTTPATGDLKGIPNSFLIAKRLTILHRESCDLVAGIEKLFQILLCLGNGDLNSGLFANSALYIIEVAFELIELVRRALKKKSNIPNTIIEFVWLVLNIEPKQTFLLNISRFLQYVVPRIVEREMVLTPQSKLEELIGNLLFYSVRCLERDVDICSEVLGLYQSINEMATESLHCPFVSEGFKLAALTRKFSIKTQLNEILAIIVRFTDSFLHSSSRHRCTTVKSLIELSKETVLVGEDPIMLLQALLNQIISNESDNNNNNNTALNRTYYVHGITRNVKDLINAITIKLKTNCISLKDTIQVLVPTVGSIINRNFRISATSKSLLTVECCTKLVISITSIHDFQTLLNHGLLLIEQISPIKPTAKEMRHFFKRIVANFLNRKNAYLLQLARITYEKLTFHYQQEYNKINTLFYHLLTEGPLASISHIYHACHNVLLENKLLSPLHTLFYTHSVEPAILRIFADISTTLCFIQTNKFLSEDNELSPPINHILPLCVDEILEVTHTEQTDVNIWSRLYERVMLVSFIFVASTEIELNRSNMNLLYLLDVDMPSQLRQLIVAIMKRIIYTDMKFYSPLPRKLIQFMVESIDVNIFTYLANNSENGTMQVNVLKVLENIQQHIINDQFNQDIVRELLSSGYSSSIFKYNIQEQVQIQNSRIIGTEILSAFRYSQYREFQHILKALHIGVFWFSHDKVCVYDLFKGKLTADQTEERLRYVKMYLLKRVSNKNIPSQHLKAIQALEAERNYQHKHHNNSNNRNRNKHTLTISLLTQFYNTLVSSNDTVDPAARPLGAHNEVPLEIAIRRDRGIVSIRDSYSNVEVERCEVIFMSEGMYVMESQTDGMGINTALVWCQFFAKLLTKDCLVPSIILPRGNPNLNTWNFVHEMISTESINTNLTWKPYYSYEWITYYPTVPEKIHDMEDIVLHPGFEPSRGSRQKMRPIWRARTDLLGTLYRHVTTTLSQTSADENHSNHIYSFIKYILMEPGNLEKRTNNGSTHVLANLNEDIKSAVNKWIVSTDLDELFQTDRKLFFELKHLLYANTVRSIKMYRHVRTEVKRKITDSFHFFTLSELPYEIQEASMVWIEQVDDALWHETERLEDPIRYLVQRNQQGIKSFPGLVCFFLPEYKDRKSIPINSQVLSPDRISGYMVGKVVELNLSDDVLNNDKTKNTQLNEQSVETFEVWGSWVEPRFRKLGIAVDMYMYTLKVLPTRFLALDMKEGVQWKCAVNVKIGCFLIWLGVVDYIMDNIVAKEVGSRWNFYLGGDERYFQRYLLNNRFLRPLVYIDTAANYCNRKYSRWKVKYLLQSKYIWVLTVLIILGVMLLNII